MLDTLETCSSIELTPDPDSWWECRFLAMERVLKAGHLDWAQAILAEERTADAIAFGGPAARFRLDAIVAALANGKIKDVADQRGCLIDAAHPMTSVRWRSELLEPEGAHAASAQFNGAPASRPIPRPGFQAYANRCLSSMHEALAAGQLDFTEQMLGDDRTARLLALGTEANVAEVAMLRQRLSTRREHEAAMGGRGSLIDPDHWLSKMLGEKLPDPLP